jgi:outer membrane protein OmpA-like peptidoglycan-associated protein
MYKGYDILYQGSKSGVNWDMENVNNPGYKDSNSIIPISLGAGINMWLNDRFGIGMQGDYLYITNTDVPNSLQGTVRLLFRFGGKSKRPQPIVTYVDRTVERVVDRPVDRIVEVEKVVEHTVNISELLSSINFDLDSYEIKPNYQPLIREIAKILLNDRTKRYLITGFTDVQGSAQYNERLSEQRATAIMNALTNEGVPQNMLKTRGAGLRIANMPANASEHAREGDRKIWVEHITNMEYWEKL